MAVPKKRTSVSRKGLRWAGHTFKKQSRPVANCPNCSALTIMHSVCTACGQYRGKLIFTPKVKNTAEEQEQA